MWTDEKERIRIRIYKKRIRKRIRRGLGDDEILRIRRRRQYIGVTVIQ